MFKFNKKQHTGRKSIIIQINRPRMRHNPNAKKRTYFINNFVNYKKKEMENIRQLEMNKELENKFIGEKEEDSIHFSQYYEQMNTTPIEKTDNQLFVNKESNKILVIISCHTNNKLRLMAIYLIMKYLEQVENIDIVIVNSSQLVFSNTIRDTFKQKYMDYYELENDQCFGFSKWYYGLIKTKIKLKNEFEKYKFTTFINDSVLLHHNINHFFDYTRSRDVELFGYNDSSQLTHHYQSYLFSVKNTVIDNFIKMFNENRIYVKSYNDAVHYFELQLFKYFDNRDCFLKIAYFPSQIHKNIFHNNDFLYFTLRSSGLLPFTKLRRLTH